MISGVYWSIGQRKVNQDSIALYQVMKKKKLVTFALVADGIGGLQEGEIASGYVAEQLVAWFYDQVLPCGKWNCEYMVKSLNKRLNEMYCQLLKYADSKRISLGTACTVFVIYKKRFLLMHVGDCNAYVIHGKQVKKLTNAHVDEMGALTRCVGSMGFYEPEYFIGTLGRKDAILLCSDGFWKMGERHFEKVLNPRDMEDAAMIERRLQLIGETNMKCGGKDNQSAIYLKQA